MTAPNAVTLHSSWRGLFSALAGGVILFVLGAGAALTRGIHPLNAALAALGAIGVAIVVFDYPVSTRFTLEGVQRRAMLRHSLLDWDRIDRFSRTAPSVRSGMGSPSDRRKLVRLKPGGLVAAVGRRRYLLVNRSESVAENQRLRALVRQESEALADTLQTPPDNIPPTWLGRRQRWRTDDVAR